MIIKLETTLREKQIKLNLSHIIRLVFFLTYAGKIENLLGKCCRCEVSPSWISNGLLYGSHQSGAEGRSREIISALDTDFETSVGKKTLIGMVYFTTGAGLFSGSGSKNAALFLVV